MSYAQTQSCGKILQGVSRTFWEPTTGSMSHSCGVCISVGQCWLACIWRNGTLVPGRAMWISMQIQDPLVGFVCV